MKKITKLSITLAALTALSAVIAFSGSESRPKSFDPAMFRAADTAGIASVSMHTNTMKRTAEGWQLNNRYQVDSNMLRVLMSILAQVSVKRPIARLNQEEIVRSLKADGRAVVVHHENAEPLSFIAGGNAAQKLSYYLKDDKAWVVEMPGYSHYISGIFFLTENQWRDRVLFSSSARTIQALKIDYHNSADDLHIYFDREFMAVEGIAAVDTTSLMDYLGQFQYFQINDYLSKNQYPRYDSLAQTQPIAQLSIEDIDRRKNKTLNVFHLIPGQGFYLVTDSRDEMMVIDKERMEKVLSRKKQFTHKQLPK